MDAFAAAFTVAGEDYKKVADEETLVLLKRFSANPDIEKAKANLIKRAQKVEESSLRILMGSIYYPTGLM